MIEQEEFIRRFWAAVDGVIEPAMIRVQENIGSRCAIEDRRSRSKGRISLKIIDAGRGTHELQYLALEDELRTLVMRVYQGVADFSESVAVDDLTAERVDSDVEAFLAWYQPRTVE